MARVEIVGTSGIFSYGADFSSTNYPMNEALADNLTYTYAVGRYAVGKTHRFYMFTPSRDSYVPDSGTYKKSVSDYIEDEKEAWYTVPIYKLGSYASAPTMTQAGMPPLLRSVSDNKGVGKIAYIQDGSYQGWLDWGMNVTSKTDFYYQNLAPCVKWNWKKVIVYPLIRAVYGSKFNPETQEFAKTRGGYYLSPWVDRSNRYDLKDFYKDRSFPAHTDDFLGYTIEYELYQQKSAGPNLDPEKNFALANEAYINGTMALTNIQDDYNDMNVEFESCYAFLGKHTLLGGDYMNNYVSDGLGIEWTGSDKLDSVDIMKLVPCLTHNYGSVLSPNADCYVGDVPVIDPDIMEDPEHPLLIDLDIIQIALQLGLPVMTNGAAVHLFNGYNTDLADVAEQYEDYVYIPVKSGARIDPERRKKGKKEIEDDDQYKKADDPMGDTPEIDRDDVDDNDYVGEVPLNLPLFTTIGVFNRYFAMSFNDIIDLADFLYTDDEHTLDLIMKGLQLNGENPMNFMIGLRMFPFNILTYMQNHHTEEVSFGNGVQTGVMAEQLNEDDSFTIDLGHCKFPKHFKNFLDYEPYTTAKLYIPYCGEVEVPTSLFVGQKIHVRLIVDITTGSCVGAVSLGSGEDEKYIMFVPGMCSVEIPMTGTNATEFVSRGYDAVNKIVSGAIQTAQSVGAVGVTSMSSVASSGASMTTGKTISSSTSQSIGQQTSHNTKKDLPSALGGVQTMMEGLYEWNVVPTPLQTQGNSTPYTSFFKPQCCYFVIQRPVLLDVNIDNTVGYACMKKVTIGDLADGTMFIAQNPNVQPKHATYSETAELNHLLATGVWR